MRQNPLLHLVGILFPHINEDARSKSHQKADHILFINNEKRTHASTREVPKTGNCAPSLLNCSQIERGSLIHFLAFGQWY